MESESLSVNDSASLTVSYTMGRKSAEADVCLERVNPARDVAKLTAGLRRSDVLARAYLSLVEEHAAFHRGRADVFAELLGVRDTERADLVGCVVACPDCDGVGSNGVRRTRFVCPTCGGAGRVYSPEKLASFNGKATRHG